MNVVEEKKLVKDWERAQVWEHTASVLMDDSYVALVNAKRSRNFTSNQMKSMSIWLRKAQEELAKCIMVVADCKARIHDVGIVLDIEYNIRHEKFTAADTLKRWVGENPAWKCFRCDTVISNTLTVTPTYSGFFPGCVERLPGLASERYATIGTFKGDRLKEKGGRFGSHRTNLRTHW